MRTWVGVILGADDKAARSVDDGQETAVKTLIYLAVLFRTRQIRGEMLSIESMALE